MLDNLNSNFESSKAQRPDANDDEVEIDLLEIFYALKKKILLVLMVALAGGCIAAAYTQFLMTPIYSSTSACQRPVLPYEQPEYCRQRNSRMHCLAPQEPAAPSYISHNPVRRRPDVCPHSSEVPYQSHWTCRADVSTESSPDLDPDLKEVYL